MHALHGIHNLIDDSCSIHLCELFGRGCQQILIELSFLSKLHDEIDRYVVLEVAIQFDDMWMVERVHYFNLVPDLIRHFAISYLLLVQLLDGIHLPTLLVLHFLYDAEAAFS